MPAAFAAERARGFRLGPEALEPLADRAVGAFLGLAVGDALGATVEFLTPREISAFYGIHRDIKGGGWLHLKPGRVTDDTEMSLALGQAILDGNGRIDAFACAEAFSAWMHKPPADIGHTVRRGIALYRRTRIPFVADNPANGGNGAAMRLLPAALATFGAPWSRVVRALRLQAHVTHTSVLSDAGCEAIAALVQAALAGAIRDELLALVADFARAWPEFDPAGRRQDDPTGFIVPTLRAVFQSLAESSGFEDGLIGVVNRGGDADTTGAILGMILGALHGTAGVPRRWRKKLDPGVAALCESQARALIARSPAVNPLGGG